MRDPGRPNIILMICHDLGCHLPCYGIHGPRTPILDRIAAEGIVLERYFAAAPMCSPSRGAILTGCYPHTNGLLGLVNMGWELGEQSPTLPHLLRARAGYHTALIGIQHEKQDARRMGYQRVLSPAPRACEALPTALTFLRQRADEPRDPFFLSIGLAEMHRPYALPGYVPGPLPEVVVPGYLPPSAGVRQELAEFHGLIHNVDEQIGPLFDLLRSADGPRNTLVIFTTDHGIAFPRAKSTLYDSGIATACLLWWPGMLPAGRRIPHVLSNVDLCPTILDVASVPAPQSIQGRSFRPLLMADCDGCDQRNCIYAENTFHTCYDPRRAVRTSRWKYIRAFEPGPDLALLHDIAAQPSAVAMAKRFTAPRAAEELYDLSVDPDETCNLADVPRWCGVRDELSARLTDWMRQTEDPLLSAPIPLAPDAFCIGPYRPGEDPGPIRPWRY